MALGAQEDTHTQPYMAGTLGRSSPTASGAPGAGSDSCANVGREGKGLPRLHTHTPSRAAWATIGPAVAGAPPQLTTMAARGVVVGSWAAEVLHPSTNRPLLPPPPARRGCGLHVAAADAAAAAAGDAGGRRCGCCWEDGWLCGRRTGPLCRWGWCTSAGCACRASITRAGGFCLAW